MHNPVEIEANVMFRLLLCAAIAVSGLMQSAAAFVGTWKLNASRSQIVDQMTVENAGAGKYRFVFTGTDGETVAADGTDQPGVSGTTLAVTIEGPRTWKVVRKKDGRPILAATWTLSEDGRTLHDAFTAFQSNGSPSTIDYVYDRTAGTSGFLGTWESTSQQLEYVYELQIEPFGGDGLSLVVPSAGTTKHVTFDGSDQPNPSVAEGLTTAGRRVSERAVDFTDTVNGKVIDTEELRMSDDGRTLTLTVHRPGQRKPTYLMFDRQ